MSNKLQSVTSASDFWNWFLVQETFEKAIAKRGFFEIDKNHVISLYRTWNERTNGQRPSAVPPISFNIEYFSQIPEPLREKGFYIIRTGNGNCIVFDSSVFADPFLKLHGMQWGAEEITLKRRGSVYLNQAFLDQWNEQSFVKALHFCGAFSALVKKICGTSQYVSGPSGPVATAFPFYMRSKRNKLERFVYRGIDDLDECLYPDGTNIVIPIEAKVTVHHDLAWHKLGFPCQRFLQRPNHSTNLKSLDVLNSKVVPVYCMYDDILRQAYLYVFPTINAGKAHDGMILNNTRQLFPKKVYKVDIMQVLK